MELIGRLRVLACIAPLLILSSCCEAQRPVRPIETAPLPGFSAPIPGQWLSREENSSGIPLGGIGAGFVELRADGLIHDAAIRNDWLKPSPPPALSLTLLSGGRSLGLIATAVHPSTPI